LGFGEPVVCRGVPVSPADLVVADGDGVVIVPAEAVADVLARCEERLRREETTEAELDRGASAAEVYARHQAF
jgi:regulator of RNase E activity RraA